MCDIRDGEEGSLLQGGLVLLRSGEVYNLRDCTFGVGGKLVLGVGAPKRVQRGTRKKLVMGAANLEDVHVPFLVTDLSLSPIALPVTSEHIEAPPPSPPIDAQTTILLGLSIAVIFLLCIHIHLGDVYRTW